MSHVTKELLLDGAKDEIKNRLKSQLISDMERLAEGAIDSVSFRIEEYYIEMYELTKEDVRYGDFKGYPVGFKVPQEVLFGTHPF